MLQTSILQSTGLVNNNILKRNPRASTIQRNNGVVDMESSNNLLEDLLDFEVEHIQNQVQPLIHTEMNQPVLQEPKIPQVKVEHVQNQVQPTTSGHSSSLPASSSNSLFLESKIHWVNQPNQNNHLIHTEINQPVHINSQLVNNNILNRNPIVSTIQRNNVVVDMESSNNLLEDLLRQHQKRSNDEDNPRPDWKKARYIDMISNIPHFEVEHIQNQVQPTTSGHSSSLPASSSNNLFLESKIHWVNQPNQNNHLIHTEMSQPVHIQEPKIPQVKVEHVQNQMQPTTSGYSSSLPASSSNSLFLESNIHWVNQANQSNHLIQTEMNQPVHIQEPKIPQVKVEHIQNQVQPTTSGHSSSLPASSLNNLFLESNFHLVNQPNENNHLIHNAFQPVHIQEPKIPQVKVEHVQNNMQPTTSKHNYCEEIYRKLRAMFPNLEREYIKTFCPANWIPGVNHEIQFNSIVDTIFLNEHSWVIAKTPYSSLYDMQNEDVMVVPNVDDTYEKLTAIFPNADPHYLRSAAEKFTNENEMTTFIDAKLQNNDYPTREQYLAKIKVTEEQQRYTKDFNVEQFLTLFPDPVKHFEDSERKCTYNLIAAEFLKNVFNRVRVNTINKMYKQCKYNISITVKNLQNSTDFISCSRRAREIPTEDIQLLQEMAFVRHREKILQHIQTMKQKEDDEFNLLKTLGGLYTCQCCFDEECMPSKCSSCDNGHIFCNSCIINGTDSKLGDGETHVPCFMDCGSEFSIATFQKVLPPLKLCIFLKKRQAAEVAAAGLEGLVFCPFCDFASIPPEGDKVFKCFNPECMKESCIKCKEPNHVPYSCGDKRSEKARQYIEEKMTEALTRTCYKCKKTFFKEEGCNKMTCTCGAHMCYICSQPVDHVDGYKHFRGQGSNEVGKCPLWTDNQVLNVETVRRVEEEARREILRQDPTMNINTTVLAPTVQPSRPGPHDGISDAHNLANMLAARVLNSNRFELN